MEVLKNIIINNMVEIALKRRLFVDVINQNKIGIKVCENDS